MSIVDAAAALTSALGNVAGLRVYSDPGADVSPPGAVVGPPSVTWETYTTGEPTSAMFHVYVIVAANEYALPSLWPLIESVTDALWTVDNAVVTGAVPGTWQSSGADLPCYVVTCEVSL